MSDELADLCLSFLKPPEHSGGSWTLNPTALADAIRARWTLIDPDDENTKRIIANAITTGQNSRPLGLQDEYSQRMWLTVADHVVNSLRETR